MFSPKKYLKRINLSGSVSADFSTLKALHKNHLYNIPFENLSIHSGQNIILDADLLGKKIIHSCRGGYCYELNGMFYHLLKDLGYKVKMISARVRNGKGGWGPEFDHLALIVTLDNEWLADVGFGDNFIEPKKFELDTVQKDPGGLYKIIKHDEKYFKLMRSPDGKEFTGEYIFTLKERQWEEFEGMNIYHQTSQESHFTKNKICSVATDKGRITLSKNKLTITENGVKKETELKD
ncbi:MAG TPA: arylamine N-acetyltransferase, partial [Ignavibacteria bacterium]|nr:arylamine N-acetyltransferase [Ignavibacteria bacterium]